MDRKPKIIAYLSSRRIFLALGLLLLSAAAGLAIAYSRTSARKSIEERQINKQALVTPTPETKPSPTASPIFILHFPPLNQPPTVELEIGAVAPGIENLHREKPNTVCAGDKVALTATASDPDGDKLLHSWKSTDGRIIGDGASTQFDTTGLEPGEYEVRVEVHDNRGCVAFASRTIQVDYCLPSFACFETKALDLTPASSTVNAGETVSFSTSSVSGGRGYGGLTYSWTTSAGRIIGDGQTARLDTTGVDKGTDIKVSVVVTSEIGNCSANGASHVIVTDETRDFRIVRDEIIRPNTFEAYRRGVRCVPVVPLPYKVRVRRPHTSIVKDTHPQTPTRKPQYQEEIKGDYPSRVETTAKDSISLRFVRKLVQTTTAVATSTTEGDRKKVTETVNQIPGRSPETPLEQAMGEGYEPWIKAKLSSPTFETTPKNAETADWRRLAASPEITWEWTITTKSKTPSQELRVEIDVEWRPTGATKSDAIKHRLWDGALHIDVDNPLLKVEQVKTATPIFSIAGLASIFVGIYPRKRRKDGEDESGEDEFGEPAIVTVRAGKEDDKTNESHDLVECSIFAPPAAARGATIMVQVFAHLEGKSAEAEMLALEFDETTRRRAVKTLSSRVARETKLTFHLAISNWQISEPVQTQVWLGDAESVQFIVDVPPDCKLGAAAGKVTVSQNSVPIGHISFILKVVEQVESAKQSPIPVGENVRSYSYAFISYASADRDKVLARVQMLEQVGIKYFQDLLSLDPGARWENELYKNIDKCDLFLLFWSRNAKESEWVMKEVEYALARKGADENAAPEIKPVIIEGPPIVPPPEKLAKLHFNDRLIYFFSRK
jgi:hypothetical protein